MWYSWFIMIQPISVLPHLLNWIIFWIEFFWIFFNWIIFWIEFSLKKLNWIFFWIEFLWNDIELNIELNHFLAKFKYWIESIWVSFTPTRRTTKESGFRKWRTLLLSASDWTWRWSSTWSPGRAQRRRSPWSPRSQRWLVNSGGHAARALGPGDAAAPGRGPRPEADALPGGPAEQRDSFQGVSIRFRVFQGQLGSFGGAERLLGTWGLEGFIEKLLFAWVSKDHAVLVTVICMLARARRKPPWNTL